MKDFSEPELAKLLNQIALGDNKAVETIFCYGNPPLFM